MPQNIAVEWAENLEREFQEMKLPQAIELANNSKISHLILMQNSKILAANSYIEH